MVILGGRAFLTSEVPLYGLLQGVGSRIWGLFLSGAWAGGTDSVMAVTEDAPLGLTAPPAPKVDVFGTKHPRS
jgi:hypothetical protein